MRLTQSLIIATILAALSCTVSANQTGIATITTTDVNDGPLCNDFPDCPWGGNEEEPPVKN